LVGAVDVTNIESDVGVAAFVDGGRPQPAVHEVGLQAGFVIVAFEWREIPFRSRAVCGSKMLV